MGGGEEWEGEGGGTDEVRDKESQSEFKVIGRTN